MSRKRHVSVPESEADVAAFLKAARIESVPVTPAQASLALDAFARYGKGRGHPAQLNMGDCFAYAMAKSHHASLLFTGDDFSKTDIVLHS